MKRLIFKMKKLALKSRSPKDSNILKRRLRKGLSEGSITPKEAFSELSRIFWSSGRKIQSPVRLRRVCSATGRSRGVFRFFGLSGREIIRKMNQGYLFGLRKASW